MQKLHLVGFTTDQTGLILSARKGARSGGYTLVLDDALAQAVDDLRSRQAEAAEEAGAGSDRVESRLPIGEIQARLRRGRSLKDVAKDAGVDPEWVERFAAPVFAEQAGIIARVQATFYKRARLGPSGLRVGDAVRRNLAERGVVMSPDEFNAAWRTHQRPDGRWIVSFGFTYRGASRTLKFEVRPNGDIVASDPATAQMAFVAPPKRPTPRPRLVSPAEDSNAKRAVVTTGFRPEPPAKAVSRPGKEREKAAAAMTKAAARRAAESERAAARKARERERALARREREAAAEALRRSREIAAKAREAAAAARLAQAEQAERERAAAALAAARQADRDAARRAARLKTKAASKTVAAKKAAADKATRTNRLGRTRSAADAGPRARPAERAVGRDAAPKPAKPPRPSPAARVDAPPPRRAAGGDGSPRPRAAAPKASASAPEPARAAPAVRPAVRPVPADRPETTPVSQPVPDRTIAPRRPVALPERRQPADGGEPRATESSRPQFRSGFAAPAGEDGRPGAAAPASRDEAPANGALRRRPPGVRRTRPLRAT